MKIRRLSKFDHMDIFASLAVIMKQNTGFYQSDFEIDKRIIAEKAASIAKEDKTLLWLSRPSGTYCFREYDVFIRDTDQNRTWRFYKEQTCDPILAYAVELTGVQEGKVMGNLYELDYTQHYERVRENAVDAGKVRLVYEHGTREQPAGEIFNAYLDSRLGRLKDLEVIPKDPEALKSLLREEKRERDMMIQGNFGAHIETLHNRLIEREVQRIMNEKKNFSACSGIDNSDFMAELSPVFKRLASDKDIDRVFSIL